MTKKVTKLPYTKCLLCALRWAQCTRIPLILIFGPLAPTHTLSTATSASPRSILGHSSSRLTITPATTLGDFNITQTIPTLPSQFSDLFS